MALTFMGATWPLNPLVTRNSQAGPAPAGCEESLAPPATPRVNVAEIPRPEIVAVSLAAPPSRSLRGEMNAAHRALVGNDRPAFDAHLRAARAIVDPYPPGGERSRAEEVLWALDDAAVLWDAQFESPFFDETSNAYGRASRYAGYADAMRRSLLTDDRDRRFYPASESRDFVTHIAGERLQRLGVPSAAPPTRTARVEAPSVSSTPSPASSRPRITTTHAPSASTPAHASTTSTSTPVPATSTPARTATRAVRTPRRPTSTTARSSKPAAPANLASRPSPDPSTVATPQPAELPPMAPPVTAPSKVPGSPVSRIAEVAPPSAGTGIVTPISTDTATTTAAPATPEPASSAVPEQAERRSVIVPALLILIGLGVLIVLFRASK